MTTKLCKIKGCEEPHWAKGYCNLHYRRRTQFKDSRVPTAVALPTYNRLLEIYGSQEKLAVALGTNRMQLNKLLRRSKFVMKSTFDIAMALLAQHEAEMPTKVGGIPLEVVDAAQLSLILRKWVVKYLADRGGNKFEGPTGAIAFWTKMSERNVSRYVNNEDIGPYIDVNTAEVLLIAIEEENALRDGRLEVIPNPALSMELWVKRMKDRGCI